MKKRIGIDAIVLFVVLIVLAVVSLQIANRNTAGDEGLRPRRTTRSAQAGGWKAAFLLLQRAGITTGRFEKPPKNWPDSTAVIIAGQEVFGTDNESYWNADQADDAREWVRRGGTLILLTGEDNALTQAIDVSPQPSKHADADVHPTQPLPYLTNVYDVRVPGSERFATLGKDTTVLFADDEPAVVAVKIGAGRVIVVASPAVIENAHLDCSDNARFLVQTAAAFAVRKQGVAAGVQRRDGVLFDEFHQGYQEEPSLWNAIGQPGQLAFLQLVILILLGYWSAGVRFGLPRPLPAQSRVSSEYVASLADLYRRARASDAALEGVYNSFWRDLCRAVGAPLDADSAEVARLAVASLGADAYGPNAAAKRAKREERLRTLLQTCDAKIDAGAKKLSEGELLTLSRALEDMRKELQLGRDDRRD